MQSYLDFGAVEDAVVVGDGADDNDDFALPAGLFHLPGDLGDGDGRPVDLGHEEAAEDDAVELGICTAGQETVQLQDGGEERGERLNAVSEITS